MHHEIPIWRIIFFIELTNIISYSIDRYREA